MQGTYTQLTIHFVFAVNGKENIIPNQKLLQVEKYMAGVTKAIGQRVLQIKCMPDHCHLLIGWNLHQSLSEIASKVKTETTKFIKKQARINFQHSTFSWQRGYGAFSYSPNQLSAMATFLEGQAAYHQKYTFQQEYLAILKRYQVAYQEEYLFEFYDSQMVPNN